MSDATIRIFSDLHFLEGSCRVQAPAQLRPLLDGADSVILNGDTLDTQNADSTQTVTGELKAFFAAHAPTTFITGNHDPDISRTHELSLAEGRIWITHGDVLFDDLTPWSRDRPEILRRLRKAYAQTPTIEHARLETRLRIFRQISLGLPRRFDAKSRGIRSMGIRFWHVLFPPRYPIAMLHSWLAAPRRAADLAAAQRPRARVIINGHTHHPGLWHQPDGRIVINTGSFCAPLAGQAVEFLHGERLRLRPIVMQAGEFRLGRATAEFPLAGQVAQPLNIQP